MDDDEKAARAFVQAAVEEFYEHGAEALARIRTSGDLGDLTPEELEQLERALAVHEAAKAAERQVH